MTHYEIQKNVPVPAAKKRAACSKYPFAAMEVGDCFDVPPVEGRRAQSLVSSAATSWAKRHNPHFRITTRVLENGGARVWRIA